MCGIAGFYGFRNDNLVKKISKELAHRGPDGEGFYINDKVTLLNRRLAIIDLDTGNQPIFNEDKSIVVVFNGEIYNYQELKKILQTSGHIFKTKSDTEIIVHGYEEWDYEVFDKLNGMFAIALYDIKKDKLLLVRDHFGIKPLYYAFPTYEVKRGLIFSSEIKPIIYSGLIERKSNDRIIYRYLKYRVHDDQRETFFKGVFRLFPGELLEIKYSKFVIKQYSALKSDLIRLSQHHIPHRSGGIRGVDTLQFRNELVKAIKYRLISDVPVGTCLSGGLDSSTVVSIVNKLLIENAKEAESVGKIQKTFSAVFPGGNNDEEKYIDGLIKELTNSRINVFKVKPNPRSFMKDLKDFIKTQEEPTISTGPYAQYKVMEEAHGKVKVLLDGQGADEMMAGYLPYYFIYLKQLLINKNYLLFIKELTNSFDVVIRYFKEKLSKTIKPISLLNNEFVKKYYKESFKVENSNLKKRLIEDIFSNSLQSLLRYEDKNAMRFSIEGRVPFLDINLVKYIFSLPDEAIIKDGWNKYILRQGTKEILPEMINQRRNKIGFTTPETQWFKTLEKDFFKILTSESFSKRSYFNQKQVLLAYHDLVTGKIHDTMLFWRIINMELWMREFIDPTSPTASLGASVLGKSNKGKKIEIKIKGKKYFRFPIKTDLFKKGDDYVKKISSIVISNVVKNLPKKIPRLASLARDDRGGDWFIVVSEKIIAISQGRSYFLWDIKISLAAKILSKFVTKTPTGIGLGSPWTMQLAINEIGLPKIILSAAVSKITKLFGIKGEFYNMVGPVVRSIDGPTEYSVFPSNVSAKLGPKEPQKVAENIKLQITNDKLISNIKYQISKFLGVVVIDANDIGRNVLGNSTGLSNKLIEKIFKDNPMGQSDEQTPITLVIIN